jgi:glycerol kinase
MPVTPAIVWQDTRTADQIERIREEWADRVYARTGWALAPVYSSMSLNWILEHVPGVRPRAEAGELAFGTIDSWLIHRLTGGKVHAIAASNASVTGSYDLTTGDWYGDWLEFLGVPGSLFPEVRDDSGDFGTTDPDLLGGRVPITGAIADQHAALFAQGCVTPGSVKCTHGTGTFLDMNLGPSLSIPGHGLNTVIAWRIGGTTIYGLEGYAAVTGSAVQWLRDGAGLIGDSAETEALATAVDDNGGVYFVPALAGLSAPYWDSYARGMIIGITQGTSRAHLVRATLEGIVFSTKDFLETMRRESGVPISVIKVDGGAARNNFLLQFQADMLNAEVVRPLNSEATSLGAAYMAGLAVGYWGSPAECLAGQRIDRVFTPQMSEERRSALYAEWGEAVRRSMGWARR